MHQDILRAQYESVKKEYKKPILKPGGKSESKGAVSSVGIYDYDGSVMTPLKLDFRKVQGHYCNLDVSVSEKEEGVSGQLERNGKKKYKSATKVGFAVGREEELKVT